MGRKRKYITEEEQRTAQQEWNRMYYSKNKEKINSHRMKRYYELQKNLRPNNTEG
jgi:hypothetical protein